MEIWQDNTLRIECLNAAEAKKYHWDFAHLRINTFREYPYFYNGSLEYENIYFEKYYSNEKFRLLALFDGDRICGMGTMIPLHYAFDEIVAVFKKLSLNPEDYLYFGEMIIEKEYRGMNLTPIFLREAAKIAEGFGLKKIAYMSIVTSESDDLRPANYRDADALAKKFGFTPIENSEISFRYNSIISETEEPHMMKFYEVDASALLGK